MPLLAGTVLDKGKGKGVPSADPSVGAAPDLPLPESSCRPGREGGETAAPAPVKEDYPGNAPVGDPRGTCAVSRVAEAWLPRSVGLLPALVAEDQAFAAASAPLETACFCLLLVPPRAALPIRDTNDLPPPLFDGRAAACPGPCWDAPDAVPLPAGDVEPPCALT